MKLKCDLIIQNFNTPVNRQVAGNQEKVHKQSTLGLYRPRQEEEDDYNPETSSQHARNSQQKSIILTIETKNNSFKYKLKKVETYTKFIHEGRATLKLIDENLFLLISNCTSQILINFISFINVKIAKGALGSIDTNKKVEKKTYVNKLLNNSEFTLGKNSLAVISPLNQKEIDEVMKAKAARLNNASKSGYTNSPVRAGNTFRRPSQAGLSQGASKNAFKRSMSSLNMNRDSPDSKTGSFKRSFTGLNDAHVMNKMPRSESSTNLLIELTDEQKNVVKRVKEGRSVFFTGSGGSGKSFLISIIKKCLPHDKTFITASTGVAASLIGGITLHAFSGVSASAADNDTGDNEENMTSKLKAICSRIFENKDKLSNWRKCQHLVIDEISMIDGYFFDLLDAVARSVKNNDSPFGGIQLVLSGDFLQLPPVSKYGQPKKKFTFQSDVWSECIDMTMILSKVKRQTDTVFINLLEEIRFGKCSEKTKELLEKNKYKSFEDREILPTKLCTHKDDVELINTRELEKIESEAHSYKAQDSGDGIGQFKVLNRLCPAAEVFKLKLNAQVILLKNLDVANSLVNGSRGCIVGFTETKMPIVKFLNGKKVTIKYDSWSFKINSGGQMATRRQLPLQLAWAISIHKSQGMTLDCAEISLSRTFEYGQAYVALSRVKSLENTKILDFDVNAIKADETVLKYYAKIARKQRDNFD